MKKLSIAAKIRKLIAAGKTTAQIRKDVVNASAQSVYQERHKMKKKEKRSAKRVIKSFISARSTKAMKVVLKKYAATTDVIPPALTPNQIQIGGEHYKKMDIQPWDAIHSWDLGFFSGNAVKYIARHRDKGGVEDLKKARHYLDKLIELNGTGK